MKCLLFFFLALFLTSQAFSQNATMATQPPRVQYNEDQHQYITREAYALLKNQIGYISMIANHISSNVGGHSEGWDPPCVHLWNADNSDDPTILALSSGDGNDKRDCQFGNTINNNIIENPASPCERKTMEGNYNKTSFSIYAGVPGPTLGLSLLTPLNESGNILFFQLEGPPPLSWSAFTFNVGIGWNVPILWINLRPFFGLGDLGPNSGTLFILTFHGGISLEKQLVDHVIILGTIEEKYLMAPYTYLSPVNLSIGLRFY